MERVIEPAEYIISSASQGDQRSTRESTNVDHASAECLVIESLAIGRDFDTALERDEAER